MDFSLIRSHVSWCGLARLIMMRPPLRRGREMTGKPGSGGGEGGVAIGGIWRAGGREVGREGERAGGRGQEGGAEGRRSWTAKTPPRAAGLRAGEKKIKCSDCCLFRKNNFVSFVSVFPLLETDQIYRVLRIYAALLQTPSVSSVCVCV